IWIAKQSENTRMTWPRLIRMIQGEAEILFEIFKTHPPGINRPAFEGNLHKRPQLLEAERSDGGLPSLPDEATNLRLEVIEAFAQDARYVLARQLAPNHGDRQGAEHVRANELIRLTVE